MDLPLHGLASGSVAVVVGNSSGAPQWLANSNDVTLFQVCCAPDDRAIDGAKTIALSSGDSFNEALLYPMLHELFGKVISRVDVHFQIDLLVVADLEPHAGLTDYLSKYLHPGAWVFSRFSIADFGEANRSGEWFCYRVNKDPEDVTFAKMSSEERRWIYNQTKKLPPGSIYLEIGSYKGGSATIAALANPDIDIYCIDPWVDYKEKDDTAILSDFSVFSRHTQFFKNITPVRIDIDDVASVPTLIAKKAGCRLEELNISMLFIDGDHSFKGVLIDLKTYFPYVNGLVSGHDYRHILSVRKAIDYYFAESVLKKMFLFICPTRLWDTRMQCFFRPTCVKLFGNGNSIWCYNDKWRQGITGDKK